MRIDRVRINVDADMGTIDRQLMPLKRIQRGV